MASLPRFLALSATAQIADAGGASAGTQYSDKVRQFTMTCQEELQWCWAAVTQSVEAWGGSAQSQSEIASFHIDPNAAGLVCVHPLDPAVPGGVCTPCQRGCGGPHSLGRVLAQRSRLAGDGAITGVPAFQQIVDAINAQRPLPVRINWGNGDGHFICVTGYAVDGDGNQWVAVYDPLTPGVGAGAADEQELRYETFANAYPSSDGSVGRPNFRYEVQ